jgi:hypothetical protein
MTRIIFVDIKEEMIIHSVEIFSKESKKRADAFFKEQCRIRGAVERIIIREGLVSIMDIKDEIPIPQEYALR